MGREASGYPTPDNSIRLDLAELMRRGALVPGARTQCEMTWASGVHLRIDTNMENARDSFVHLHLSNGRPPARVRLVSKPQHLGGVRWWFVCPWRAELARVLYLPQGASEFASRGAFARFSYLCQREIPADRLGRAARKARRRLGLTDPDLTADLPPRPHRMRSATYWRLRDDAEAATDAAAFALDDRFLNIVSRLMAQAGH